MLVTAAALVAALASSTVSAFPFSSSDANTKRQANAQGDFGLTIGEENLFDLNYLQTYKLSYANESAFIGQVKYQQYSEPLIVSGAMVAPDTDGGLGFLSEHSAPTGFQYGYILPGMTAPLRFTTPHTGGAVPDGAATTGFRFSGGGPLMYNDENKFYACQGPDQAAINTYQVWWIGGEQPVGCECKGPIGIMQADPCARGN